MVAVLKDRCQNCYPDYGVHEIYEPSEVEAHEGLEVSGTNACSHPNAVMVKASNADIALWTMDGSRRLECREKWRKNPTTTQEERKWCE